MIVKKIKYLITQHFKAIGFCFFHCSTSHVICCEQNQIQFCRETKLISFCSSFSLIASVNWRRKNLDHFHPFDYLLISTEKQENKKVEITIFIPRANISSSVILTQQLWRCAEYRTSNKNMRNSSVWFRKRYLNILHPTSHIVFVDSFNVLY